MKDILAKFIRKKALENRLCFSLLKLFKPDYRLYKIRDLYSVGVESGGLLCMLDDSMTIDGVKLASNPEDFYSGKLNYETRTVNRKYICLLHNAFVLGETNGIIHKDCYLTDQVLWNPDGLKDFLTKNIRASSAEKVIIKNKWKRIIAIDHGISLVNMGSFNYFHLTFEVLARICEIDTLNEYLDWPFLVDEAVKEDERSRELLKILNVNNRPIIWVKRNLTYCVNDLLIPPNYTWIPYNEPKHPYIIDKKCIEYIRSIVEKSIYGAKKYNKVYIARGNNERLTNESKLIEILENNGFYIFNPDKASLYEEISIFHNSDVIVGVYGAAFTNAIYCKKDVEIMVICPFELQIASGVNLFEACGIHDYKIIPASLESRKDIVHYSRCRVEDEGINMILSCKNE